MSASSSAMTPATRRNNLHQEPLPWKAKILIVDDNPENLVALEAVLESTQYEMVRASSGREALRYLLEEDFAAILLDVKMPDMDGFETATMIRARKRSEHVPILFLTAFKNDEHLSRGYNLGAVDFLIKPIIPEILKSKVAVFVQLAENSEILRSRTEELQRKEQKFRALLEAAPDAMVITAPDGAIDLVNGRAEFLFEYQRDYLRGEPLSKLIPDWTPESMMPFSETLHGARASGDLFPIDVTCSPLETETGRVTIHVIRDITERKRAEKQIREMNLLLEQKVKERTAELTRSNEELAQFAYIASHDLKEPLRTIAIFAQLLADEQTGHLSHDTRDALRYINDGVRRMHELIDDLLSYSQVDSSHTALESVDLNSVLDEVLLNLHVLIQESGCSVSRDFLPQVVGDRVQLAQLLQNLLGNSIKYRSSEPLRIHVGTESTASDHIIWIQDNGIGIDPRYAEAVFKLFKRLHSRDKYPGNGVGLAICRKIVERSGGRIWVDSRAGSGAKFCFALRKS